MGNILMDSLILFLLIYALLDIFTRITEYFSAKVFSKNIPTAYHVIFLDSTSENLEYGIRKVIHNAMDINCEVLVVDMDTSEENRRILDALCTEYDFLYLFTKEQYIEFLNQNNLHFSEKCLDTSLEHK